MEHADHPTAADRSSPTADTRRESLDRHSSSEAASAAAEALSRFSHQQKQSTVLAPAEGGASVATRGLSVVTSIFQKFGAGYGSVQRQFRTGGRQEQNFGALTNTHPLRSDDSRLRLENLLEVRDADIAIQALFAALEKQQRQVDQDGTYCCAVMDLITHLCEQDSSKHMVAELSRLRAAALVNQLLLNQLDSAAICEAGFRAICSLITLPVSSSSMQGQAGCRYIEENQQVFGSANSIASIMKAVQQHLHDDILLEWGLRVMYLLATGEGMAMRVIQCDAAGDIVAMGIREHASSDDVVVWCCRNVVRAIAAAESIGDDALYECQQMYVRRNIMGQLVRILNLRLKENRTGALPIVLRTLGYLIRRNAELCHRLVDLDFWNTLQNLSVKRIDAAEALCWLIGSIAFHGDHNLLRQLGETGACNVVTVTLQRGYNVGENQSSDEALSTAKAVQEALRALHHLCRDGHPSNCESFIESDVPSLLLRVHEHYDHSATYSDIIHWIWYAIVALAANEHVVAKWACGTQLCNCFRIAFERHCQWEVCQWASAAARKLLNMQFFVEYLAIHSKWFASSACKALSIHLPHSDTIDELLLLMAEIVEKLPEFRDYFCVDDTMLPSCIAALRLHQQHSDVVFALFCAMNAMLTVNASTDVLFESNAIVSGDSIFAKLALQQTAISMIVGCSGCQLISSTLMHYVDDLHLAYQGCRLLRQISLIGVLEYYGTCTMEPHLQRYVFLLGGSCLQRRSTKVKSLLQYMIDSTNCIEALKRAIEAHASDTGVLRWALLALCHLATDGRNTGALADAAVDSLVISMLDARRIVHSNDTITICFRLISLLCVDDILRKRLCFIESIELVLSAIAHLIHDKSAAMLGSDVLSALCISPATDALSSIFEKGRHHAFEINHRNGVQLTSFHDLQESESLLLKQSNAELTTGYAANEDEAGGWQTIRESVESLQSDSNREESFENNDFTECQERADPRPSLIRSFFGWKQRHSTNSGTKSRDLVNFSYQHQDSTDNGNSKASFFLSLLSTGLTDAEEESHNAAIAALYARRSGSAMLMDKGATAVLSALAQTYSKNDYVLIAIANAFNSLALRPDNRLLMNKEGMFDLLVKICDDRLPSSQVTDVTHTSAVGSGDAIAPSLLQSGQHVLLMIVSIVIGTACLPYADEDELLGHIKNAPNSSLNQTYFGEAGACRAMGHCLRIYRTESLMCEAVLRAINFLCYGHETNQSRMTESHIEGQRLVLEILKNFIEKPRVVYFAVQTIAALCQMHHHNCRLFGEQQAVEWINRVMNKYKNSAEIMCACCHAVSALALVLSGSLGAEGTCEKVMNCLVLHESDNSVVRYALRAISALAEEETNIPRLEYLEVFAAIKRMLQRHVPGGGLISTVFNSTHTSVAVIRWGCTVIFHLTRGANGDRCRQIMVEAGLADVIARSLVQFSGLETLSHICCRALVALTIGDSIVQSRMGSIGVCTAVVEATHMYSYSAPVATWGCRLAAVLAENHEGNTMRLSAAGLCESVPLILQSHPNDENIAAAGCDIISFMSATTGNKLSTRFGQAGGCEAVVSVLRQHLHNPNVVRRACVAISILSKPLGNAKWLGPAGACEVLIALLSEFGAIDSFISKHALSAISHLCRIEKNRDDRLGAHGACELILRVAASHKLDLDCAIAASEAIIAMCEPFSSSALAVPEEDIFHRPFSMQSDDDNNDEVSFDMALVLRKIADGWYCFTPSSTAARLHLSLGRPNRARLYDAGCCEMLIQLLLQHSTNPLTVRAICNAIAVITQFDACRFERSAIQAAGACSVVAKALYFHEGNADVCSSICVAVSALCYHCSASQLALNSTEVAEALVVVLRAYRFASSATATVEAAADAIACMCQMCNDNQQSMGVAGAVDGLLESLELHIRKKEVVLSCCQALFHLCDKNDNNKLRASCAGVAVILQQAVGRYLEDHNIVDYVLCTLISLAASDVGRASMITAGICKTIVPLLHKFERGPESLLLLVCALMAQLAWQATVQVRSEFLGAGANKAIATVLARFSRSASFSEENRMIASRSVGITNSRNVTDQVGLAEIIGTLSVMKECCKFIVHMIRSDEGVRVKFQHTVAMDVLISATADPPPSMTSAYTAEDSEEVWVRRTIDALSK